MKTTRLAHLIITLAINFHVIGITTAYYYHQQDGLLSQSSSPQPAATRATAITKVNPDKSSTSSSSSWFSLENTGLTGPASLKPKLFQLPYEKIASPLSSFISWITRNDRNVRIYDRFYVSGKSITGQRSPGIMDPSSSSSASSSKSSVTSSNISSPMTSSSNINPLPVSAPPGLTGASSSSASSSLSSSFSSSPLAAIIPSIKSASFPPVNQRRQDLLSSFSFTRPSSFSLTSSSSSSSLSSSPLNSGRRSNIFNSKDISTGPQFHVSFPRSTPAKQRQLSPETLSLIAKYNPKPKVYFIPKYYTSPYQVAVPFITHNDKFLIPPNQSLRGAGDDEERDDHDDHLPRHHHRDRDYDRDEHESIENNSMAANDPIDSYDDDGDYARLSVKRRRRPGQRTNKYNIKPYLGNHHSRRPSSALTSYSSNHLTPSVSLIKLPITASKATATIGDHQLSSPKRYRSSGKPSSSSWRAITSNNKVHRPYTGKAQYSTIDNSADPMSPSASTQFNPFW